MSRLRHVSSAGSAVGLAVMTFAFVSAAGPDRTLDTTAAAVNATAAPDREAALRAYAELPLAFTENRGQADRRVRYYLHGSRSSFFLTAEGVVMALTDPSAPVASPDGSGTAGAARAILPVRTSSTGAQPGTGARADRGVALALRFVGASLDVAVEGHMRAAGEVNYLRGSDSSRWRTGVPRFMEVVYRDLWPGIDMVLRSRAAALKYEFRVRPGARPSDIRLAYDGARSLSLGEDGSLVLDTIVGQVRDSAPVSWQETDGRRTAVDSRYALAPGSYGFALGEYDPRRELVIDPGLDYSTFLGGASMDRAGGIAVDGAGNTYVVGSTQSTDFPTTAGAFDRTFNGGVTDVFVAKLNPTGSGLVYATYLGGVPTPLRRGSGDNVEFGRAIAVDANGSAYITGLTDSSNFPTTGGAFQPALNATPDDARDAFVVKLNAAGSGLVYSTFLGGTGFDDGWSIAVDGSGNAHVIGDTDSTDFPTTAGAAQGSRGGGRDAFVTKLNAAGSAVVYSTYLGGLDNEVGNGIALDAAGNAYVAGGTRSADFPATPGAFQPAHGGGGFGELFDAFAARLNAAGALVYSTFLGGSHIDVASDVAVDSGGNAYVAGSTSSAEFPTTTGAFDRTSRGGFVTKLNAGGSNVVYSTFLGGADAAAIVTDSANRAWVVGTASAGAPATADGRPNGGGTDAWLARLNATGSALEFATFLGGGNSDNGAGVALDPNALAYITGTTVSFDFPTTAGAFDTTFGGDPLVFWGDAFVAKFGAGGGTVNPQVTTTTTNFSGSLDRNRVAFHTVLVGGAGPVNLTLNWTESRTNLTVRVRDNTGTQVFFNGGTARPKTGSFQAAHGGSYSFEVANTGSRRTNYTLSVTHPFANSFPGGVSFLSLDPATVAGGASSTGIVSLTAAAPSGGAVVALSSSNTAAATVPATVTVAGGNTSATFTVATSSVGANATSTISATYNGISKSASLTVNAAGGPAMASLSLNPTSVQGGGTSSGTATLTAAAPAGGAVVTLISSNTDVATVPASVTVAAGQTGATFTVSTSPQQFDQSSAISASHGGVMRTVILPVTAGGGGGTTPAAALSSISLSPTTVTGGNSSVGTATLTAAAPSGGFAISLTSSHAAAAVPSSVTVAAGASSATFSVSTTTVTAATGVTIAAGAGGVSRTAGLTVNPATTTTTANLTVSTTGRSGERVTSSPTGINVSVGSTGSASFATGTSITLTVSNGREAVWSGACSSGDNRRRSCTFTLNGNASVSANVR